MERRDLRSSEFHRAHFLKYQEMAHFMNVNPGMATDLHKECIAFIAKLRRIQPEVVANRQMDLAESRTAVK